MVKLIEKKNCSLISEKGLTYLEKIFDLLNINICCSNLAFRFKKKRKITDNDIIKGFKFIWKIGDCKGNLKQTQNVCNNKTSLIIKNHYHHPSSNSSPSLSQYIHF